MITLNREKSMAVFAMNLLCSDEERMEGRGTWVLSAPVPVAGMDGRCQGFVQNQVPHRETGRLVERCLGRGKIVQRTPTQGQPGQYDEREVTCQKCNGSGKDGTPTFLIEEIVVEGSTVHTFCRDEQTSNGERIVHSPFMVHSVAHYGPIPVWREYMRVEDEAGTAERVVLVMDIEGERWEVGKTIPTKQGQPGNARIVRMYNVGDAVRVYAEPDRSQTWNAMRADLSRAPAFGPSGDFGLMFSIMSLATRLVRTTMDLTDYRDVREMVWQSGEKIRLGVEDEEEPEEPEEPDDPDNPEQPETATTERERDARQAATPVATGPNGTGHQADPAPVAGAAQTTQPS